MMAAITVLLSSWQGCSRVIATWAIEAFCPRLAVAF
jgi:hypothetical protein